MHPLKYLSFFQPQMSRLSRDEVLPEHYDLHIKVDSDGFSGHVEITLHTNKQLNSFKLNSRNLEINSAKIRQSDRTEPAKYSSKDELLTISSPFTLSGSFSLIVEYSGKYSSNLEGFYKGEYNSNMLLSTHFEPTGARGVLPCFDQPDMKAIFSVQVEAPSGYIALSNAPCSSQTNNLFKFEDTPIMSTYLLAFVVGKLESITKTSKNGTTVSVYMDASHNQLGQYALDVAAECLSVFEEYFDFRYPLSKLDMVAIPEFAMGAMENWGLVTYRATSLLYDPKTTPVRSKKNIAVTVCHELAHMWFGNLVTMEWWSDLWLNEGFATWAASLALSKLDSSLVNWDVWTDFILDEVMAGMEMDALRSTHPIEANVTNPVEIEQIFDAISYSKGSSVIRMIEGWLGANKFRDGIRKYMKKYKYGNATTSNLWECLNVVGQVEDWIKYAGFPLIKVLVEGETLILEQERFTALSGKSGSQTDSAAQTCWNIPIRILWSDKSIETVMMNKQKHTMKVKTPVFKLNAGFSGFYRVEYPADIFDKIFNMKGLTPADKLNLYSDRFELAKSLRIDFPFTSLSRLKGESNYAILATVLSALHEIASTQYDNQTKLANLKHKISDVISDLLGSIDVKKTDEVSVNDLRVYSLIISMALFTDNKEVEKKLRDITDQFGKLDDVVVRPDFMRSVFSVRADDSFDELFSLYRSSLSPSKAVTALSALGSVRKDENVRKLFNSMTKIKQSDAIYLFASLGNNLNQRDLSIELFIENFKKIREHITNDGLVRSALKYTLSEGWSDQVSAKVDRFLAGLESEPDMKSAVEKAKDGLAVGRAMRAHYKDYTFE